ncbi:Ribosomal RNA processing protein 36 homolog [Linum perenne]
MPKFSGDVAAPTKTQFPESEEDDEEISSSSSSEEEEDDDEEDELERELADVTFEELQKARSNGSDSVYRKPNLEKKTKRANKNMPVEVTCKKPVSRFREVIQAPKKVVRDPRFESLCGTLNVEGYRKRYNFLYENDLPAEKEELKKQLKKSKDPAALYQLKNKIAWIDKQLKFDTSKQMESSILTEHKKKEREAVKHGKQPFYLKKCKSLRFLLSNSVTCICRSQIFSKASEIKKQRLVNKYKELKENDKLDSFIEKRRKKNASKDHRFMPYRRSTTDE